MDTPSLFTFLINWSLLVLAGIGIYMTAWFTAAAVLKRNDLADIAWGLGIAGVPVVHFLLLQVDAAAFGATLDLPAYIISVTVTIWGLRLAWHIGRRFLKKDIEDGRYAAMRNGWKRFPLLQSYLRVFLFQGLLIFVMSIASTVGIAASAMQREVLFPVLALGAALWLLGFAFEAVGDWQLAEYLESDPPKGSIMTSGLWRYTRHPNYFGEVTLWWGVWLMTMSLGFDLWWTIATPLLISFLILKVSGIPMTEARWKGNKKFEAYKRKTSAFFPLPPKE